MTSHPKIPKTVTMETIHSEQGVELPTEYGIAELTNGLTVHTMATPDDEFAGGDEQDGESGDLKHMTLRGVTKALWRHIACKEYTGANGEAYMATFSGKAAVECMLAPDTETAIDYLSQIMAEDDLRCSAMDMDDSQSEQCKLYDHHVDIMLRREYLHAQAQGQHSTNTRGDATFISAHAPGQLAETRREPEATGFMASGTSRSTTP